MSTEYSPSNISIRHSADDSLRHPVCSALEGNYQAIFDNFPYLIKQDGCLMLDGEMVAQLAYANVEKLDDIDPSKPSSFAGIVMIKNPGENPGLVSSVGFKNGVYWDSDTNRVYAGAFNESSLEIKRRIVAKDEEEFASTISSIIGSVNEAHLKSYI